MSRLETVIASLREQRGDTPEVVSDDRLGKAIKTAKGRLGERFAKAETAEELVKGCHDAMFHHAMHAKAAHGACYPSEGGVDKDHADKCKGHAMKHEFMMARHALENARKKAKWPGDIKHKMQRAMDFFSDEAYGTDEDPEYKKAHEHYKKGGEYKGHKDDKFKEDY